VVSRGFGWVLAPGESLGAKTHQPQHSDDAHLAAELNNRRGALAHRPGEGKSRTASAGRMGFVRAQVSERVAQASRAEGPEAFPRPAEQGAWRVTIPPGGSVVIRFRVSPQLGKYVFHCHILEHEDGGMMMAVLGLPNEAQRRIALGSLPGRPNTVVVKDGDGASVGRVHPGPRNARGGVVTATGDVNGDLDEEVIAATPARAGSPASVSVYDGDTLKLVDRFRPFPESPRAGLSIATGDIDRDGRAEIIVGRAGPGASLVRIFRRNGAVFRTLRGFAGRVQVWAPVLAGEHGSPASSSQTPQLLATLHPVRKRVSGGVRLAVTRLGRQALDALVAWGDPSTPTYVSINDEGVVSRVEPRSTARGALRLDAHANLGVTTANRGTATAWLCLRPGRATEEASAGRSRRQRRTWPAGPIRRSGRQRRRPTTGSGESPRSLPGTRLYRG
jgi:hypothetical protein